MVPQGFLYSGTKLPAISSLIASHHEGTAATTASSSVANLTTWWKNLIVALQRGDIMPEQFKETISEQIQLHVDPLYREPDWELIHFVQSMFLQNAVEPMLTSLFFHIFVTTFEPNVSKQILPKHWMHCFPIIDLYKTADSTIVSSSDHFNHLSAVYTSTTLSDRYPESAAWVRSHMTFRWTRLAYRLIIKSLVSKHQVKPDDELRACLSFLFAIEASDLDSWLNLVQFLTEPLYAAICRLANVTSEHVLAATDSASSCSTHPPNVLTVFSVELANLIGIAHRVMACASTLNVPSTIDVVITILFDRLAALLFYKLGMQRTVDSRLWDTLYGESQCKAVESWSAFWLSDD